MELSGFRVSVISVDLNAQRRLPAGTVEPGGVGVINGFASFGNAALNDPGDVGTTIMGLGLAAISAGGDGLGLAADATGVGALGGVPLNVVSTAGVVAGVGIAGHGLANIAANAGGKDHISPMSSDGNAAVGGERSTLGDNPPKDISGRTPHGEEQAQSRDGGRGVSDQAMDDAVKNPEKSPEPQANGTYKYVGKNAIVILNSDGKVVTTWARNSAGWRNR
jgi:hypothetical protein